MSEGQFKAVCHYCQKTYRANSKGHGTTNLLNHTPNCVKNPNRASLKGQQTLAFEPKMNGEEGFKLVPTAFTVEASRKALAEMIIIDELPFRFVEGYGFQKYSTTLQPKLQIRDFPSRQTVARDVISIYGVEREKLREALKGRRVCLTTDTWTSIQNLNYMSLTGHFIDDDWNLHKRILNFCQVEDHRGETIGRKIEMCLREWGVDGIFTLTVDNASSNGATIKFLQTVTKDWKGTILEHEFLHMRCCAHILNLIVGDGMKEIDPSIARVREAVRYVKSSPNRNQTFRSIMERLGIESKCLLSLDVPTRWNSTYLMLDTAEKFEKVFLRMDFEDDSYSSYFLNKENSGGLGSPCGVDFQNCRTFVGFLKLFYNATKKFSGSLYVTSNTFFDEMFVIQENIAHLIKSQNHLLKNMATKMEAKFEKYWGKGDKINKLLYVVVVLDPRKKMRFLKFSFFEIYGDEVANEMVDLVGSFMARLYDDYSRVDSPNVVLPSENERTHMEGDTVGCSDPYAMVNSRYERFLEVEKSIGCSNEMEKYLAENCESRRDVKFEILGWWKANSDRYPVLSKMARDVLAVPVSTVASESAFSTGGRILDPFRSSLSPLMVQNLICAQNWLQARVPISFRKSKDEMEALEDEFHELVLNQTTTAANSSSCSNKGGTRTTVNIDE
ncbi:zinc finger BED domain-containing protein RICESLEEPER 2-like [Quercus robur]|uniref:zinc finger BED domain-containing protein RICESLEEPER 2-like n=1 Tax=Quercus robur TaxID=38942 RepID=UPI0021629037|nr:zinc finger BED domain-containing protein RICESLEEPER 2-like [Quercus robur]